MEQLLGLRLEPKDLSLVHISLRGIIVFIVTLVMVRVADRRFLAKLSAFDVLLGFLLASMMARAVNGSAAFWPTMAGGFVLVFLHRLFGLIAFHWDGFGRLVKGDASVVVERGKLNHRTLKSFHISEKDLFEEMRLNGNVDQLEQVKKATLERNGKISIVSERG
ncbi:MAG TPA: YetF domain-containing protein [Verrucomicrobiae bacterium]|nr:YetF domain-containing protein [Verrucomicrobiae bacterium]